MFGGIEYRYRVYRYRIAGIVYRYREVRYR